MPTKITSGMGSLAPLTIGKYTLLQRIAAGGMAEIWVARSAGYAGSDRLCVIKMILPNIVHDPKAVQMFLDEARIAATLQHQNVVQMYEVGEMENNYFIAMEYLHGEDTRTMLRYLARRNGRLPLEHAVHIAIGMLSGLHYAHSKKGIDGQPLGIVHRDVSPHNLFVTYDGTVKLVDFGIAKAANRTTQTKIETLKGKVRYMSPEQCRCLAVDHRSDVYSAGVVLYELTTNKQLNSGIDEYEIMKRTVDGPVPDPTDVLADYPPDLAAVVVKALSKKAEDRYATASKMQEALEQFAFDHRLRRSSIGLAEYMHDVFDERIRTWNEGMSKGTNIREMIAARHRAGSQSDAALDSQAATADTRAREDDYGYDAVEISSPGTGGSLTMASGEIRITPSRSRWGWIAAAAFMLTGAAGGVLLYLSSQSDPVVAAAGADPAGEHVVAQPSVDAAAKREALIEPVDPSADAGSAADDTETDTDPNADTDPSAVGAPEAPAEGAATASAAERKLAAKARRDARRDKERERKRTQKKLRDEAAAKKLADSKPRDDSDKKPDRATGDGELRIASKPSCRVIINGKPRGDTPLALKLPAGKHRIRLVNREFGIDVGKSVTVKPDTVTKKRYSGASLMD